MSLTPRRSRGFLALVILSMGAIISVSGPASAQKAPADPKQVIVASRGGHHVTLHEIDAQVMALPKHLRASFLNNPERIEEVISGVLINKQLAARIDPSTLESDPYYLAQERLAVEELLARRARQDYEDEMMSNPPDFEMLADEIFRSHPHRFRRPVTLKLNHVLVRIGGRGETEARARAEQAREAFLAGDRDFRDIFLTFSDEAADPRGLSNGVLENIVPGLTEPSFEEIVFQLTQPGEISEIIQTSYGFHVAQLVTRTEPTQQTFEEVRQQLVSEQREKFFNDRRSALLAELRGMPVEAKPIVVAQLRSRYARAAEGVLPGALDGSEVEEESDPEAP